MGVFNLIYGSEFSFSGLINHAGFIWKLDLPIDTILNQLIFFEEVEFWYSVVPRVLLSIIVGACLGMTGSILQQLTQNPLVSPLTLGASSGAWLALVLVALWFPSVSLTEGGQWVSLMGSIAAIGLVFWIAGYKRLNSVSIVLAGMAVHMLLSAIAMALVTLNDHSVRPLFLWGAGDLTQSDSHWLAWVIPKVLPVLLILPIFAYHPLKVLKLGDVNAKARGVNTVACFFILGLFALYMLSVCITAVGLIGFVALITPNLARALGTKSSLDELYFSALLGALMLLLGDLLALFVSNWSLNLIPTGSAVAFIGAPYLILLIRRYCPHLAPMNSNSLPTLKASSQLIALVLLASLGVLLLWSFGYSTSTGSFDWSLSFLNTALPENAWPKVVAAFVAGAAMAISGCILQTLVRNPLASPDILGLSAGATLALIVASILLQQPIQAANPLLAFAGSMVVLCLLVLLGQRHQYAPSTLILIGIALTALLLTRP